MSRIQVQIAPDIEFKMLLDIPGVDANTRDYDLQQHKAEIYAEFEKRLKQAFPEGLQIDTFEFGFDSNWKEKAGSH